MNFAFFQHHLTVQTWLVNSSSLCTCAVATILERYFLNSQCHKNLFWTLSGDCPLSASARISTCRKWPALVIYELDWSLYRLSTRELVGQWLLTSLCREHVPLVVATARSYSFLKAVTFTESLAILKSSSSKNRLIVRTTSMNTARWNK